MEQSDILRVVSRGGLVSNENSLYQSSKEPGCGFRLLNYEPSLYGGYRRINGYTKYDEVYPQVGGDNAEGKVLGLAIFKDSQTLSSQLIAARKDKNSNSYSFYRYVFGSGWIAYNTNTERLYSKNSINVFRIRHATFNFGNGNSIVFVDGVNPPIIFDGDNWTELNTGTDISGQGPTASNDYDTSLAGGDQLLQQPNIVSIFQNHIFFGADYAFASLIFHSAPNNPYNWNVSAGAGQVLGGFEVIQIKPFRDNLFVFGEQSIRKIIVQSENFVIQNVTNNVGCIARDSVVEIGGDLAFLAPDGLRPVAGTSRIGDVEISSISKQIQQIMVELSSRFNLEDMVSVVVNQKSQIRMFFDNENTEIENSYGILGSLVLDETRNVAWEFTELMGIRASISTSDYVNGREYVIHGDYNGVVYQQEIGNSFDGNKILAVYETPYLDFDSTGDRKTVYKLKIFFRPEGPIDMNFFLNYDWGDDDTKSPPAYREIIESGPITYDTTGRNYNEGVKYNQQYSPVMTVPVEGSGFSIKTTFVTYDDQPPYTIQGFTYEFMENGKR